MRVVNDGLPLPLYAAVSQEREPREGYSISQLVNSTPQQHALKLAHDAEIEEPASSRIWAAMGTAMHLLLSQHGAGLDGHIVEERLHTVIDGVPISGQFDVLADGVVGDWKFVGVASTFNGVKPEHALQVRLYAYLLHVNGFDCHKGQVTYIYRDWMQSRAKDHDYPPQVQTFDVPLWEDSWVESWLKLRIVSFQAAEAGYYDDCTPEETWQRPTQYAVTKFGNKRAARLLPSFDEATAWAIANTPANREPTSWFELVERPGADVRCESYCNVSAWCAQRARRLEE